MKQIKTSIVLIAGLTMLFSCKNGGKGSFQQLKPGIEFQIFPKGSKELVKEGDYVRMHIVQKAGDSTFMSTYDRNEPIVNKIQTNPMQGGLDPTPVFFKMAAGDSAVIRLNADSAFGGSKPPFLKKDDQVLILVKVVEILSKQESDSMNAQQAKMMEEQQKQMAEMQKKREANAAKLKPIEDAKIKAYIASKGINATKLPSGVYYAITTPGAGANAAAGQKVQMKYTGKTLAGVAFDSNTDPAFGHVSPFEFTVGTGQVIPGWEQGIPMFNKGAKGILLIPSYLAYGENPPPGGKMNANEILAFDVEVVDIK